MKDKELEKLEDATEAAYKTAIEALINVVNCVTAERNYYIQKCQTEEEK